MLEVDPKLESVGYLQAGRKQVSRSKTFERELASASERESQDATISGAS